jgi:hypothetical protein
MAKKVTPEQELEQAFIAWAEASAALAIAHAAYEQANNTLTETRKRVGTDVEWQFCKRIGLTDNPNENPVGIVLEYAALRNRTTPTSD